MTHLFSTAGHGKKTRIGIIYPSDGVRDREFWAYAPGGVSVHLTREIIPEAAKPIGLDWAHEHVNSPEIDHAAASLAAIHPAAVGYACTSVSFVDGREGDASIRQRIETACGAPATTTSFALAQACKALGLRRVAVATPYAAGLASRMTAFLNEYEIDVAHATHLDSGAGVAEGETSVDWTRRMARDADSSESEGLLITCTNLPTQASIEVLEQELGKPVVSAIQATVWHACLLGGVQWAANSGTGRLWESRSQQRADRCAG